MNEHIVGLNTSLGPKTGRERIYKQRELRFAKNGIPDRIANYSGKFVDSYELEIGF